MTAPASFVEVFMSCAPEDGELQQRLERHLSPMRDDGLIRSVLSAPGDDWPEVEARIERARVILLLVTVNLLDSRRCREIEIPRALTRAKAGRAHVIPVLLRACDWRHTPFGGLRVLPRDGRPVKSWQDEDEAFVDVARGIREVVSGLISARTPPVSRAQVVKEVMQKLKQPECVGVAVEAPLGFEGHRVAGQVLELLQRPGESLLPVRLVPDRHSGSEDVFYERLLRDLRWSLPDSWRQWVEGRREPTPMDRFDIAVDDLLSRPVKQDHRELLFGVDGLAYVARTHLDRWGHLMKQYRGRGMKLLVWGGQELHDLRTTPPSDGLSSAFHELHPVHVGALSNDEVDALVVERGGDARAVAAACEATAGHPALVRALVEAYPKELRAAQGAAIMARLLRCDHLERLRREVRLNQEAQKSLRRLAGISTRPLPPTFDPGEDRLRWLGVLREGDGMELDWTAPVMARFAEEWA